jgi:hypothetical protein
MATDTNLIQGEIADTGRDEMEVERLIVGFLRALLDEQRPRQRLAGEAGEATPTVAEPVVESDAQTDGPSLTDPAPATPPPPEFDAVIALAGRAALAGRGNA